MNSKNWDMQFGMVRRLIDKAEEPIRKGVQLVKHHGYQINYPWACPEICGKKYRVLLSCDYPDARRVIAILYSFENNNLILEKSLDGLLEGFKQAVKWLDYYENKKDKRRIFFVIG